MDLTFLKLIVQADEKGSISAAARHLGWLPATASAALARAEDELGGKLFTRTTRSLKPTPEGQRFLEQARLALATLDEAREVFRSGRSKVEGLVRLTAPADVGQQVVMPALDVFLETHPGVRLVLELSDRVRDLWRDDVDAAIRYGTSSDSSLVARKLADTRRVIVAAPAYLKKRGVPRRAEELAEHECVLLKTATHRADVWQFSRPRDVTMVVKGRWSSNNGAVTRQWALAGHGLALKSWIDVCEDVAAGRLVHVLPAFYSQSYPIMLMMSASLRLATRMRALGDCLAERFEARLRAHPFPAVAELGASERRDGRPAPAAGRRSGRTRPDRSRHG
jgi:DNA-binding transcriptional LysR family regulator